ncbi:MAG: STM3941 family protein [Pelobium sp.]
MIRIEFKKSEIIISIILCFLGIAFLMYLFFFTSYTPKAIAFFLMLVIFHVIFLRLIQLNLCLKHIPALRIDDEGIINHTNLESKLVRWNEIVDFKTGYYRTNSIYINPKNPALYQVKTVINYISFVRYVGSFFRDKPDLLWIDIDVLAIKKPELLNLLNRALKNNTNQN